ncbi:MAG TPA: SusC/RagA family TonB-linked outer membrane protein [Gemmatimonadaceae bacterium]|nr:SusC/RagA family TonB-linked outer membrane protein [Gemmatimonadaceae bacterium]
MVVGTLLGSGRIQAQVVGDTIKGQVLDTAQAAVGNARVTLVGTPKGAVTRSDGRYVITGVAPGQYTVSAAHLGYQPSQHTITVTAGQTALVDFELHVSAFRLQEQVVVAYGTQTKADVTGSVATIAGDEVNQSAVASVEQGLQGRMAGVNVIQNDAAPGGGISVQIRGMSTLTGVTNPLYVVDGVIYETSVTDKNQILSQTGKSTSLGLTDLTSTNPLAEINPADIESIDILKDASATALYGSRATNGVVIITTKRGHNMRTGHWTLNLQQGYAENINQISVLNAYQYATYVNTAYTNANNGSTANNPYGGANHPGSQTPSQIQAAVGNGINWQNKIYHTAPVTNLQGGFLGGDDHTNYAIAGSYLKQSGSILGSEYDRYGIRANIDRDITSHIKLYFSSEFNRTSNNIVFTSTQTSQNAAGVVRMALQYPPFLPLGDSLALRANPQFTDPALFSQYGANPLDYTDDVPENQQYLRGIANARVTADLTHHFSIDASVGGNFEQQNYSIYTPSYVQEGGSTSGLAVQANSQFSDIQTEDLLRYGNSFGPHRLDVVGGYTYEADRNTYLATTTADFPNDFLGANALANALLTYPVNNALQTWALRSWLGRVNYSYADRYLATATIRQDCSSLFADNNKCATFPAFALAWRPIEESFMKNQPVFSDLKVRASWGQSGNTSIGPYQSLGQITTPGSYQTPIGNTIVSDLSVSALGNPNLKWETTSQLDLGMDFGLFDQRVTFTGDYYSKRTVNLLQALALPDNTGFSSIFFNSGIVTNKGVELGLALDVFRNQRIFNQSFSWNISANAFHNVNNVVSLGPIAEEFLTRLGPGAGATFQPFIEKPGLPLGTIWGYVADGIFKTQAEVDAYKDIQPGATIGSYRYKHFGPANQPLGPTDERPIGNVNPDWVYGMTNRFKLGRFDLSALVNISRGNSIINLQRFEYLQLNGLYNEPVSYVQNAYNPTTNPNGKYAMINSGNGAFPFMNSWLVEDGSYLRLKNVQLGYTIDLPGARVARIYVSGINLLTSTNYTGYDPEVGAAGNGIGADVNHMPGVDQGSYPMQRIFSFGVNTSF